MCLLSIKYSPVEFKKKFFIFKKKIGRKKFKIYLCMHLVYLKLNLICLKQNTDAYFINGTIYIDSSINIIYQK